MKQKNQNEENWIYLVNPDTKEITRKQKYAVRQMKLSELLVETEEEEIIMVSVIDDTLKLLKP